jgi:uncharacterized protein YggE
MKSALFLATMIALLPAAGPALAQNDATISVSGDAVVKVVPDRITIHLGIETWDNDVTVAKKQNGDILAAAMKAIAAAGVEDKDVQTAHLSIEPHYEHVRRQDNFIGYCVRNALSVVVDDPDRVEGLITDVLEAGVTHIHGVEFTSTKLKEHRDEARRLALEAAAEKAGKMAAVLGKTVGNPVHIEEGRGFGRYFGSGWGFRGGSQFQNVMQNNGQDSDVTDTLALGKISIRAYVRAEFALE